MAKTETVVKTTSGLVQYFSSEEMALAVYNASGNWYDIRDGKSGRELWHKGNAKMVGVIETIPMRKI